MSGLAAWLHHSGWPVEIVAGRRRPGRDVGEDVPVDLLESWEQRRWPQGLDEASSLVAGMAFRLRRLAPWLVDAFLYADAVAAHMADQPYVVSFGGMVAPELFTGRPELWQLFSLAAQGARRIVVPSRAAADHLKAMFGFDAVVVPDGVDMARFADAHVRRQPGLILGPVFADDARHRIEVLIDAFGMVAGQVPEAELVITGPVDASRCETLVARVPADVRHRVRMVGAADRQRMVTWYARATVTCAPAAAEASGTSLVESLAAGTPVVAAASGVHREIVTGPEGILYATDDARACAEALIRMLRESADGERQDVCRRRARDFDWTVIGPQLASVYREAR